MLTVANCGWGFGNTMKQPCNIWVCQRNSLRHTFQQDVQVNTTIPCKFEQVVLSMHCKKSEDITEHSTFYVAKSCILNNTVTFLFHLLSTKSILGDVSMTWSHPSSSLSSMFHPRRWSWNALWKRWLLGDCGRLVVVSFSPKKTKDLYYYIVQVVVSNIFLIFTPIWGRFPFWLIFFQMGWNHQLAYYIMILIFIIYHNIIPYLSL